MTERRNQMENTIASLFLTAAIDVPSMLFGLYPPPMQPAIEIDPTATGAVPADNSLPGHAGWTSGVLERLMEQLVLTDAQERRIRAIFEEHREEIEPLIAELKENREQLRSMSKDGLFHETDVLARATRQAAVLTDLIVAKQEIKTNIYAVLTEAQRMQSEKIIDLLELYPIPFAHGSM